MPRIAIAQIRPTKGEYAANLQRIGGVLAQLAKLEPAVDLVVFPETATSGYFVEGGVRDVAVTAGGVFLGLRGRHEGGKDPPAGVAGGVFDVLPNQLFYTRPFFSRGRRPPPRT